MEIGPYRLKDDSHLRYNDGSWDEFANLLFIDNPVGTGYSYVDTNAFLHELTEMANQMVLFLEKWFSLFPEYEHDDVRIRYLIFQVNFADRNSYISLANLMQVSTSPISQEPS